MTPVKLITPPFYAINGWAPIERLCCLLQRFLGAERMIIKKTSISYFRRAKFSIFKPKAGKELFFFIISHPGEVENLIRQDVFSEPASMRVLWIIDSFWTERVNERLIRNFDLIIYMSEQDSEYYDKISNGRALFVPWGSDVLHLGGPGSERNIDVLRVGRQPDQWECDSRSACSISAKGLNFHGRPRKSTYVTLLSNFFRNSKFSIASSNLIDGSQYTHPKKEYFTGRWVDSISNGASVAGIPPLQDSGLAKKLWPNALFQFSSEDFDENVEELAFEIDKWNSQRAYTNYLLSLERLDWRWDIECILRHLSLESEILMRELDEISSKLNRAEGV